MIQLVFLPLHGLEFLCKGSRAGTAKWWTNDFGHRFRPSTDDWNDAQCVAVVLPSRDGVVSQNDEHGRNNVPFADYIDLPAAAQEKRATEYRWKLCEKNFFWLISIQQLIPKSLGNILFSRHTRVYNKPYTVICINMDRCNTHSDKTSFCSRNHNRKNTEPAGIYRASEM